MDAARGGWFEDTPDQYPDNAWYTYDDKSCGYMMSEYGILISSFDDQYWCL